MPGYRVHMLGGGVLAAAVLGSLVYFSVWEASEPLVYVALVATSVLAALFPDVDTASKGRGFFYGLMAITDLVLIINEQYQWAALLGFFAMLPAVDNHRGWTHTWWAMLLVPAPILLLPYVFFHMDIWTFAPFYVAAVAGYFSHLALDREF